jgi:hypothetical protein
MAQERAQLTSQARAGKLRAASVPVLAHLMKQFALTPKPSGETSAATGRTPAKGYPADVGLVDVKASIAQVAHILAQPARECVVTFLPSLSTIC